MTEIITTIVGVLATALIAWFVYAYRNKIVYELETIAGQVSLKAGKIVGPSESAWNYIVTANRLKFSNEGYRTLRDVELHLPLRIEPVYIKVAKVTSLSAQAVKTTWEAGVLKITVPTLPASEIIAIELFSTDYNGSHIAELRGTGGQYRILTKRSVDITRSLWRAVGWTLAFAVGVCILIFGKP